ncbi:hypothetical protein EKO27_g7803 [Xylaria grammica]|uniref:Uncharacterized protein n=1 Tax=Xylaria grammica TaxID=363999 RepID=A0A439CYR8_9PEZI|nr:hypothetical protein EKO27_g7803 [Xylaria grammica]
MGNNDADGDYNIEMDSGSGSDYDYSMGESDSSEIDAGNKNYLSSHLEEWTGSLLRGADEAWATLVAVRSTAHSLRNVRPIADVTAPSPPVLNRDVYVVRLELGQSVENVGLGEAGAVLLSVVLREADVVRDIGGELAVGSWLL